MGNITRENIIDKIKKFLAPSSTEQLKKKYLKSILENQTYVCDPKIKQERILDCWDKGFSLLNYHLDKLDYTNLPETFLEDTFYVFQIKLPFSVHIDLTLCHLLDQSELEEWNNKIIIPIKESLPKHNLLRRGDLSAITEEKRMNTQKIIRAFYHEPGKGNIFELLKEGDIYCYNYVSLGRNKENKVVPEFNYSVEMLEWKAYNVLEKDYIEKFSLDCFLQNFKCISGNRITPEMIKQAIDVDTLVYPLEYRGKYETCLEWWSINRHIYTMVINNITNEVVGYINIMPIREEFYKNLKAGIKNDTTISIGDIEEYNHKGSYRLYLSSVAILPEYQNTSIIKILLEDCFLRIRKSGIKISSIIATVISEDGKKLLKKLGFERVDNSDLYEVSIDLLYRHVQCLWNPKFPYM